MADKYLNPARAGELWTATKTAIATAISTCTTPDDVATAIAAALTGYATSAGVGTAITAALAEYMTGTEANAAIAEAVAGAAHISIQTVDALPATGSANVIYLVSNGATAGDNARDEYMWISGKWEKMGSTEIDLSGYWQKTDLVAMTAEELAAVLV